MMIAGADSWYGDEERYEHGNGVAFRVDALLRLQRVQADGDEVWVFSKRRDLQTS